MRPDSNAKFASRDASINISVSDQGYKDVPTHRSVYLLPLRSQATIPKASSSRLKTKSERGRRRMRTFVTELKRPIGDYDIRIRSARQIIEADFLSYVAQYMIESHTNLCRATSIDQQSSKSNYSIKSRTTAYPRPLVNSSCSCL